MAVKGFYKQWSLSQMMKVYNNARLCGKFEQGRVNRALGIVMRMRYSGVQIKAEYSTTMTTCNCMDSKRGNICKHRIAQMMIYRLRQMKLDTAGLNDEYFRMSVRRRNVTG